MQTLTATQLVACLHGSIKAELAGEGNAWRAAESTACQKAFASVGRFVRSVHTRTTQAAGPVPACAARYVARDPVPCFLYAHLHKSPPTRWRSPLPSWTGPPGQPTRRYSTFFALILGCLEGWERGSASYVCNLGSGPEKALTPRFSQIMIQIVTACCQKVNSVSS